MSRIDRERWSAVLCCIVVLAGSAFLTGGCGADSASNSCQSTTCSGHGGCAIRGGQPICTCQDEYSGSDCSGCAAGFEKAGDGRCLVMQSCGADGEPCGANGSCDDSTGAVACRCNSGYAGQFCTQCAAGYHESGGDCLPDSNCQEYLFGKASFIYDLKVASENGADACCFDVDGDGTVDNRMGASLAATGGIVNQTIQQGIQAGRICSLLEYHGLASAINQEAFALPLFACSDSDENPADNANGEESFFVARESFAIDPNGCASKPLYEFEESTVKGGHLAATTPSFSGLNVPAFSSNGVEVQFVVNIKEARLEADLLEGPNGIEAHRGKLGGAVPIEDYLSFFNRVATEACECLGVTGNMYQWKNGKIECRDVSGTHTCNTNGLCKTIGDGLLCLFLGMTASPDVDLDGDQVEDALSVGVKFETTSAKIVGIAK